MTEDRSVWVCNDVDGPECLRRLKNTTQEYRQSVDQQTSDAEIDQYVTHKNIRSVNGTGSWHLTGDPKPIVQFHDVLAVPNGVALLD